MPERLMNLALNLLKMGLARSFTSGVKNPEAWADAVEITRAHRRVLKEHGGAAMDVDPRSILSAIADFRRSGRAEGFRDLKYV